MIKHAFKIITNQWRKNVWIMIELFIVLSVLWYTVDFFSVRWLMSRTPPGFDIKDTYLVRLALTSEKAPNYIAYEEGSEEPGTNFMRLVERLRLIPDIEAVCTGLWYYPYCIFGTGANAFYYDSLRSTAEILWITPEYFDVFHVRSSYGDTNEQLKAALNDGYIINKTMEEQLFPGNSAKGQSLYTIRQGDTTGVYRISNVVNMRRNEINRPRSLIFYSFTESELMKMDEFLIYQQGSICIRTRPGSNYKEMAAKLENELKGSFEAGNFLLAGIQPISELRDNMLWRYGINRTLQYSTIFTIFFLVNVFLGVLGTFWLRIHKRREEIGIRMALGSSRRRLVSQMHIESFILVCIAAIPAALVWMNIVFAELLPTNRFDVTASRLVFNTVFTLGLTALAVALATWYPARKAASMPAAEALRYE